MRSSLAFLLAGGLWSSRLSSGCATPSPSNDTGTAGSSQSGAAGSSSSGSAGTTGSGTGTGNTTGSGSAGTTGSGTGNTSGAGTAGAGGPRASPIRRTSFGPADGFCDLTASDMIQGSWYSYGDGSPSTNSMCMPSTGNPCSSAGCCMMGATIVDYDVQGVGLRHRHGARVLGRHHPDEERLRRPGEVLQHHADRQQRRQPVRIAFSQSADACRERRLALHGDPGVHQRLDGAGLLRRRHLPELGGHGRNLHEDGGRRHAVDMQIQIPGAATAPAASTSASRGRTGPFRRHRHRRLGRRHVQLRAAERVGHAHDAVRDAHVMCPKDYIVQNNAWGSTAGQTVTTGRAPSSR